MLSVNYILQFIDFNILIKAPRDVAFMTIANRMVVQQTTIMPIMLSITIPLIISNKNKVSYQIMLMNTALMPWQ